MARLKEKYKNEIVPQMSEDFGYKNRHARAEDRESCLNVGAGDAKDDAKLMEKLVGRSGADHRAEAGRHRCRRKSIANFHLRENMPVGCQVTLRRERMYEFLDRMISVALPRVRDFGGISARRVRRTRQLHAGDHRADHLPGDRTREGREDQGDEHHASSRRPDRRGVQGTLAPLRHAFQTVGQDGGSCGDQGEDGEGATRI